MAGGRQKPLEHPRALIRNTDYGPYFTLISGACSLHTGRPARAAGLRGGDVIVQSPGQAIANIYDYTSAVDDVKLGVPVEVVFARDVVTPGARP